MGIGRLLVGTAYGYGLWRVYRFDITLLFNFLSMTDKKIIKGNSGYWKDWLITLKAEYFSSKEMQVKTFVRDKVFD